MSLLLRNYRIKKGLSQKKAAELIGVSDITYNRWEQNKAQPRESQYLKISEVLGIDIFEAAAKESITPLTKKPDFSETQIDKELKGKSASFLKHKIKLLEKEIYLLEQENERLQKKLDDMLLKP
ncbi:MAG: helix-turn-helix domain-containing protein [Endomicrobium sp.]|nr:helix-turn-helix domain-containing protein [Endomicrobium sp.]